MASPTSMKTVLQDLTGLAADLRALEASHAKRRGHFDELAKLLASQKGAESLQGAGYKAVMATSVVSGAESSHERDKCARESIRKFQNRVPCSVETLSRRAIVGELPSPSHGVNATPSLPSTGTSFGSQQRHLPQDRRTGSHQTTLRRDRKKTMDRKDRKRFQTWGGREQEVMVKELISASHMSDLGFYFMDVAECQSLGLPMEKHHVCKDDDVEVIPANRSDWTEEAVIEVLRKYGCEEKDFAQDEQSKGFASFVQELVRSECALYCRNHGRPDAFLRRVVRLVIIVIVDPARAAVCVETKQLLADGRERVVEQLPGTKIRPLEDVDNAVQRYLKSKLRLPQGILRFEAGTLTENHEETTLKSRNYPGIVSAYQKHTAQGSIERSPDDDDLDMLSPLSPSDTTVLKKFALDPEGPTTFSTKERKTRDTHFWEWRDLQVAARQLSKQIPLKPGETGWSTDTLRQILDKYAPAAPLEGNNCAHQSRGVYLKELLGEVQTDRCTLHLASDGCLIRQVDVVVVRLRLRDGTKLLVQSGTPTRLPEIVKMTREEPHEAASRFLKHKLEMLDKFKFESGGDALFRTRGPSEINSSSLISQCPLVRTVVREAFVDASLV